MGGEGSIMVNPLVTPMLHPTRANLLRTSRQSPGGGVASFCSWDQLAEQLKKAGAIREEEDVTALVIEDGGLMIYMRIR
jgi:hypothetical protein